MELDLSIQINGFINEYDINKKKIERYRSVAQQ